MPLPGPPRPPPLPLPGFALGVVFGGRGLDVAFIALAALVAMMALAVANACSNSSTREEFVRTKDAASEVALAVAFGSCK